MKKDNVIQRKSYPFAVKIVRVCSELKQSQKEFVLGNQLLRSGTSIGANIEEAIGGQSRSDFLYKITVSYKEARETHYWIRLMRDTGLIDNALAKDLLTDVEEILRIIGSIQRSIRQS